MKTAICLACAVQSAARQTLLLALTAGLASTAMAQPQPIFLGDNNTSFPFPGEKYIIGPADSPTGHDHSVVYIENYSHTLREASIWQTDGTLDGTHEIFQLPYPWIGVNQVFKRNGYTYLLSFGDDQGLLKLSGSDIIKTFGGTPEMDITSDVVAVEDGLLFVTSSSDSDDNSLYKLTDDDELIELGPADRYDLTTSGTLVFYAVDNELWRTDGTPEGTVPVYQGGPFSEYDPYLSVAHNGMFFFEVIEDGGRLIMATSDGADDVVVLAEGELESQILPFGDHVVFVAETNDETDALYISDGTPAGTSVLLDIHSDLNGYGMWGLDVLGDKIVLGVISSNDDSTYHGTIYLTDGTEAGTTILKDNLLDFEDLVVANGVLYFWEEYISDGDYATLWVSDGTVDGTRSLTLPASDTEAWFYVYDRAGDSTIIELEDTNDYVVYAHNPDTDEVVNLGSARESASFDIRNLTRMGDKVVFRGFDGDYGLEPWVSNGTVDGTNRLGDLIPGPEAQLGNHATIYAGENKAFFFVPNSEDPNESHSLYATDGTPEGTKLIKADIDNPGMSSVPLGDPYIVIDDIFYFLVGGMPSTLWYTDGETAMNTQVAAMPAPLVNVDGKLILTALTGGIMPQPSVYDVTTNEVRTLAASQGMVGLYTHAGSHTFLQVMAPGDGTSSIHITDGTPEGTQLLLDVSAEISALSGLHVNGKALLLTQTQEPAGMSMSALAPVPGEPELLATFPGATTDQFTDLFNLVHRENTGASGRLDNGNLVFAAPAEDTGEELWITDGTPEGTVVLKDINPGAAGSSPAHFTSAGHLVYFAADDGLNGRELWQTDGTPAGTVMVADLNPGPRGALPSRQPVVMNEETFVYELRDQVMVYNRGQLLFPANDGTGFDLWLLPSANAGPEKIELTPERIDLGFAPGTNPGGFVQVGDTVFLQATTPQAGRDLWAMPLGHPSSVNDWALY